MASPNPSDESRVRVGLLLIAVMAILSLSIFFIDVAIQASSEGAQITVLAQEAPGLRPGSEVWVAGRPAGRVRTIAFLPPAIGVDNILVTAVLDRRAETTIRADATIEVRASDLMAPVVVAIDPGTGSAPPWDFADTLRASPPPIDQEGLLALVDTLFLAARDLEARGADARRALEGGSGTAQLLQANPDVARNLQRELTRLRVLLYEDLPRSSFARLASDTLIGPATQRITDRLQGWSQGPERESAKQSLNAATAAVESMGMRLEALLAAVEQGEGTAGRALMDREIERQLEILRSGLAKLVDELMHDPSRWLRVRVF